MQNKATIKFFFRILAVILGILQAWGSQFNLSIDGVTYLDIADAYLRKDWESAINGGYSPLYSWILALFTFILKPSPYWESSCVVLVNLIIYFLTIWSFEFFLTNLLSYYKNNDHLAIPKWLIETFSYVLFIFCSLNLIGISEQSPDMCISGFIYLLTGILLLFKKKGEGNLIFFFFGITLGLGCLTKEIMFPLAIIFILTGMFLLKTSQIRVNYILIVLFVFSLIASPFIYMLSASKGRFTYGDAGRLNYAWFVNGIHDKWFSGIAGHGSPVHPPEKIFDNPLIYNFQSHFKNATHPYVYDPSYWWEGVKTRFEFKKQINILLEHFRFYLNFFFQNQSELVIGFIVLFYYSGRGLKILEDISKQCILLLPSVFTLGLYSFVNVEKRYLAAFIFLFWLGLFLSLALSKTKESEKLFTNILIAMLSITLIRISFSTTRDIYHITENLISGTKANKPWVIAHELKNLGLNPKDKIATLWEGNSTNWARLAKLRITCEPWYGPKVFWQATSSTKSQIIKVFKEFGIKAIIAKEIPSYTLIEAKEKGWQNIGGLESYIYIIRN
ncbi:MAG: hypothetical protein HY094_01315 [Candidatus Melainabacteria bacterium]|nr:hypothetical protein [Candidatus Melainabacteria bacterium]